MKAIRPALVFLHRWFGLLAALWLFLLALTGCVIVFYQELDLALNPHLLRVEPKGERLPVAAMVAAAEARAPGAYVGYFDLPDGPDHSAYAYFQPRPGSDVEIAPASYAIHNPYTGELLGERTFGAFVLDAAHLPGMLYQLHIDLMLGDWMVWLLGVVALLWIGDHIISAILSFPKASAWAASFRIHRGARGHKLVFDLHRAAGLWLFPVTLMLAVSGVFFNLNKEFRATVDAVSPLSLRYDQTAPALPEPQFSPALSIDEAIAVARAAAGGAEVDAVNILPAKGLYWVRLFDPRDLADYGQRWIYVSMDEPVVLSDTHQAQGAAGDVFLAWQYPLHSGRVFGWTGRLIVFASGLAVCALCVTGVMIWAKKRAARLGARRRPPRAHAPAPAE